MVHAQASFVSFSLYLLSVHIVQLLRFFFLMFYVYRALGQAADMKFSCGTLVRIFYVSYMGE